MKKLLGTVLVAGLLAFVPLYPASADDHEAAAEAVISEDVAIEVDVDEEAADADVIVESDVDAAVVAEEPTEEGSADPEAAADEEVSAEAEVDAEADAEVADE